tara:strand:- start:240 stop:521 length:282 start_codon:yes stop_codon:yes gene_type:complete
MLTGKICHKLENYKFIDLVSYNLVGYYDNLEDFIDEVLLVQELRTSRTISDNIVIKIAKRTWQKYEREPFGEKAKKFYCEIVEEIYEKDKGLE